MARGAVGRETTKGRNDETTRGNTGGPEADQAPAVGVFPMVGKSRADFSNGWKKRGEFFQWLEKWGEGQVLGCGGRGDGVGWGD